MTAIYGLPYYTIGDVNTELIVSNPTPNLTNARLLVFDERCAPLQEWHERIPRFCTRVFSINTTLAGHAGLMRLSVEVPQIVHLLYVHTVAGDVPRNNVQGSELAGDDQLLIDRGIPRARAYGFGYRTSNSHHAKAVVYISNPHPNPTVLNGTLRFFDAACQEAQTHEIEIGSGCTRAYPCPNDTYGFGWLQVDVQPVVNVLHFDAGTDELTGAELVEEFRLKEQPDRPDE